MSGCEGDGAAAAGPDAVRLEPAREPPKAAGSESPAAGTDAVTTQYRKMSVSDGMSADQAALSDGALPELMPESPSDATCLAGNPEASVQLGAPVQP